MNYYDELFKRVNECVKESLQPHDFDNYKPDEPEYDPFKYILNILIDYKNRGLELESILFHVESQFGPRANAKNEEVLPVYGYFMKLIGEKLRHSGKYKPFMDSLLDVISKFRREETTHITLDELEDCLVILVTIVGKYDKPLYEEFVSRFLSDARTYYTNKQSQLLSTNDILQCINNISSQQKKEYIFTIDQIPNELAKKFADMIAEILITPKVQEICGKATGLKKLLELDYVHKEELAIVYNFFHEVQAAFAEFNKIFQGIYHDVLVEALGAYKTSDPLTYIDHVIEIVEHYNMIVSTFMKNDKEISKGRIDTIHKAIAETNESAPSEGLAYYLDKWLRENDSKENIKIHIDMGLRFLALLKDRDIFIDYAYKKLLCNRLLEGKSTDNDYERYIVKQLQEKYNVNFGKPCFDLLDTYDAEAVESDDRLKKFQKENPKCPTMKVIVFNKTSFDDIDNVPDPHSLITIVKPYREFYQKKFPSRNLNFLYFEGKITMEYIPADKVFVVPPIVAAFLLTYSASKTEMSIKQFLALIGVNDDNAVAKKLEAYLHPLCFKKGVVDNPLSVDSKNSKKPIPVDAPIKLVKKYKCNASRLVFEPTAKKKKIVGKIPEKLSEDRSNRMEAFIVRYCKMRLRVKETEIQSETRKFVEDKFDVQPDEINKVIEALCCRGYLMYEEDSAYIKYLA